MFRVRGILRTTVLRVRPNLISHSIFIRSKVSNVILYFSIQPLVDRIFRQIYTVRKSQRYNLHAKYS